MKEARKRFSEASSRMHELLDLVDQERQAAEALESTREQRERTAIAVGVGDEPPEALQGARQGELAAERALAEIRRQREAAGGDGALFEAENTLGEAVEAMVETVVKDLRTALDLRIDELAAAAAALDHLLGLNARRAQSAWRALERLDNVVDWKAKTILGRSIATAPPKAVEAIERTLGPALAELRSVEEALRPIHEAEKRAHEERNRQLEREERSKPRSVRVSTRLPDGRLVDAKGPEAAARKVELDRELAERAARESEADDLRRPWAARP